MDKKYIPASGNDKAKLFILGESPNPQEVEQGKLFIGPQGKELDKLLSDSGIARSAVWLSTVSKYMITPNFKGKKIPFHVRAQNDGIDITEQLFDLQNEINQVRPNCILALGSSALWALKGTYKIGNWRGSILHGMGRKFVATYHPKDLLSYEGSEFIGYWNRQVIVLDFKRAKEESEFPELELPSRNLQICRSSAQLADFISRNKSKSRPAADIEARGGCIPNCIGIAFSPHEGLTIPLWNTGEIEDIVKIPNIDMVNMWLLLDELLTQNDIVGQNFKYDEDKINRLGFTIRSLASDTMLKSFVISPELPKRLAFNTSIYTKEPYYKDEGMYEGKLEDLLIGCARDSCVTKEIDLAMDGDIDELELRPFYENFVLKLHNLYLGIENEGFYVNDETKRILLHKYTSWSERLNYELFTLTGDYTNVNSPKQVHILLFEILKLPLRTGTGEEEITTLLNNAGKTGVHNSNHRRVLEIILEKRRVDKTIGNYMMALPDFDGKMKTTYFLCNETGRTSTGQLESPIRPNLNMTTGQWVSRRKAGQQYKNIGTSFQTLTKHGDIGEDIRSMYEPEKGYVLLQADSAQAEARVVFLLADDEQALKDIDEHDYHALTASWFFGGCEDDYSKKKLGFESPIRFAGKTLRHAGHLGAGKRRASISVNTDARKFKVRNSDGTYFRITEPFAEVALKIFHSKQPKIQGIFQRGVINCLEKDKRYLTAGLPYGIDSPIGGKRLFFERWGDELFRVAFSYIPQRSITDNTKCAALRLKARLPKLRIILESHDSLLFMIRENEVEELGLMIKEEMERPIDFSRCSLPRRALSIPCELEIGYNYQEFKKLKFASVGILISNRIEEPKTLNEKFYGVR